MLSIINHDPAAHWLGIYIWLNKVRIMDTEQIGASAGSGVNIGELASSMHKLPQSALNRIFLGFSKLASQLGASIVQANDFAAASALAYAAVLGLAPQRDSITAIAIKSIIAKFVAHSGLAGGIDGASSMEEKEIASILAESKELSAVKLKKAYRELDRLGISGYVSGIISTLSRNGTGSMAERIQELRKKMLGEGYYSPDDVLMALDRMSMHRGLNPDFIHFISDMYIYASNPLKIALLAAAQGNSNLGSYYAIIDEARKRFKSLSAVKSDTLYATLKRDSGICGVKCIGKGKDGKYAVNADIWALVSWAFSKALGLIEDAASSGSIRAGAGTLSALLGVETRSKMPHSLSLYAIFDILSHNGFRPMTRIEFMNSAESRGWSIDLRHALNMLSKSGVIDYTGIGDKSKKLDPDKDIKYRLPSGSISEAGIEALARSRPYVKGVIPKVVGAINAADKDGFSIYDIHKSSGVFLQGVEKAVHGLAELGLLVRNQQEYMIVPGAAARIAWEQLFSPLGSMAMYAACDDDASRGIISAGVICRMDRDGAYEKESLDSALDLMINRYAGAETKRLFRSSENGGNTPRDLVLRTIESSGEPELTRKQILDGVSARDSRMNEDRLSWYLLQLRREGRLTKVEGKYRCNRQC